MIYDRVKQQSLSIKLVKRQLIGRSNAPKKRRRNNKVGFICEITLGLDDDELSYPTMFWFWILKVRKLASLRIID